MWRSRTSICTSSAGYACVALLACACGKGKAVAELVDKDGQVDRDDGSEQWQPVSKNTLYYYGDGARTHTGSATFDIGRGAAQILLRSGTVVRFGDRAGNNKLLVEGTIELTAVDRESLDLDDVKVSPGGKVRVTRKRGESSVELLIGDAKVQRTTGETVTLEIGKSVAIDDATAPPIDAGVRDAPAPVDAAVVATLDAAPDGAAEVADATIEVTGQAAELLAPGETSWTKLPAGAGTLAKGSSIRLGPRTTARVTGSGIALALGAGARFKLGDDLAFALEGGPAAATASAPSTIALPGGALALAGGPRGAAEAKLDSTARETRVTVARGGAKLTGGPGLELVMNRGETAALGKAGAIRVIEAIPSYFDLRVVVGESATIHDPRPPTAVQFQFDGKCPDGGVVEVDRDARFRTPKLSSGHDFANVMIGGGAWAYRLRCTTNGAEGGAVASGRIAELRDDGRRPLPKSQGVNDIEADGRIYRISYQSAIPNVAVHVRSPGATHKLHLASAGKEQTFDSTSATIMVPSSQLREGTYTFWLDHDGVKQDKVSTLHIDFDQTAPQVYIEAPANGEPWKDDIDVRGAVLPGWTAAVGPIAIPIDRQRRFSAKVGIPAGNALAIQLSHPQRGVHYYLRRGSR